MKKRNIGIVKRILDILDKSYSLIKFVKDRPGHDYKYSLDFSRIRKLGWRPKVDFESGIKKTVKWYKQNSDWLELKTRNLAGYWRKVYFINTR